MLFSLQSSQMNFWDEVPAVQLVNQSVSQPVFLDKIILFYMDGIAKSIAFFKRVHGLPPLSCYSTY